MKKQFSTSLIAVTFLFFGVFVFVNQVYAETEVSGNITSDTIWTLANSPYVVTANVQVLEGAILTIDPGVMIKFNGGLGLNIDGKLVAIGTETQKITFTSNSPSPSKGNWGKINFSDNSIDATINATGDYLDGSVLKNCIIEYGDRVIEWNNTSPYIGFNIIRYNRNGAIYGTNTGSLIIGNQISYNGGNYGGSIISIWNGTGAIIKNNVIKNNSYTAISQVGGTISILNNIITDNSYNGLYSYEGGVINAILSSGDVIKFNIISNNSGHIDHSSVLSFINSNAQVDIEYNNIFNNNTKYIVYNGQNDLLAVNNYWGTTNMSIIDSKIYDYYDDVSLGKVNYEPYALAELKFDGTDTFSQPPACVSWTYSSWSICQFDSTQTRTVISSLPSSCTGGNPILTQLCAYTAPICTAFTYSDWGSCTSNLQTRSVTSNSPTGCTGGNPLLSQSCIYTPPACTSWTYSNWGACANNQQTRTIISSQPANCAGGNAILNQSCNSTPLCTENNWTSILTPTSCPSNGQQVKTWTKIGQCQNGVSHSSEETVSCNYQTPTCTSFTYSDWGLCNSSGVQSRTTLSVFPSGCMGGSPMLSQSCMYTSPICSSWTYSDWSNCSNGLQTRMVISSYPNNCSGGSPILSQSCGNAAATCSSWVYSNWGSCVNNQQTRTIISSQPTNCAGGNPALIQNCNSNNAANNGSYSKNVDHNFIKVRNFSAVYWLSADNIRYLFSNRGVFSSWFVDDFFGLKVISQDEFDNLQLGENLTVKPGNYLKFSNSDRTYYVQDNNNICRTSEKIKSTYLIQAGFQAEYNVVGDCQ